MFTGETPMIVKVFALSLSVLSILTFPLTAQSGPNPTRAPQEAQKVGMEIGSVSVWLGMSKSEVVRRVSDAGYKSQVDDSNVIIVGSNKSQSGVLGTTSFRSGMLIFASRSWFQSGSNLMAAVIGALSALASQGSDRCSISSWPVKKPDFTSDNVGIYCGKRSVILNKGRFGSDGDFIDVDERIGSIE